MQNITVQLKAVTNDHWVAYFIINAFRATFSLFRYLLQYNAYQDMIFQIIWLLLTGLCCLFLSLALHHQYKHRSTFGPRVQTEEELLYSRRSNEEPKKQSVSNFIESFLGIQTPLFLLLMLYILTIYIEFTVSSEPTIDQFTWPLFMIFYFVHRIPIMVWTFLIVTNRNLSEGPSLFSRFILFIAITFYLMFDVPLAVWATSLQNKGCVFGGLASLVDMVQLFFVVSLVLFMGFIRLEFVRSREECAWRAEAWNNNQHQVK